MMTNRISVRFYSVEKLQPNGPSLKRALEHISQMNHEQRQIQLGEGVIVRLERFEEDAGELCGEFTRVRDTDFPFEVRPDGVRSLQTEGPIGTGVAFRFRPGDHTLAMQFDTRIVSPGRVVDFFLHADTRFGFSFTPKLDEENWLKFNDSPIRKLRIGIASPQHLDALEGEGEAVGTAFRRLGEAYSGQVITIEIGMGHRRGALSAAARQAAGAIGQLMAGGQADVRSLKGWIKPAEDRPVEEINLIDEFLSDKIEFPSPKNNPDENYAVRKNLLRRILNAHV
jgi:hypothetical protein